MDSSTSFSLELRQADQGWTEARIVFQVGFFTTQLSKIGNMKIAAIDIPHGRSLPLSLATWLIYCKIWCLQIKVKYGPVSWTSQQTLLFVQAKRFYIPSQIQVCALSLSLRTAYNIAHGKSFITCMLGMIILMFLFLVNKWELVNPLNSDGSDYLVFVSITLIWFDFHLFTSSLFSYCWEFGFRKCIFRISK